ncbi:MAG: dockerin type I repeat-containing protein [Candidatus Zixiibacteriota bacterium]
MKNTAFFFLFILLISGGISLQSSSGCGDINSDTNINILDVTFLINYLYKGGEAPQDIPACDVDLSGAANLLDVTYLIRYLYAGGPGPCPVSTVPQYQKYIFEIEYLNWAWGYRLKGTVIDNQGYIYNYNYYHDDTPWDTTGLILTEADLDAKFAHNQELVSTIPMDTLLKYYNMIEAAAQGQISPPITRCFDFGLFTIMAYQVDTLTGGYNSVLLFRFGDAAQINFAPQADVLYKWLFEDILGESADSVECGYY